MKIENLIALLFISILLFTACDSKTGYDNTTYFTVKDLGEPILLEAEIVEFDEPIMLPGKILLVDSVLLVENKNTENLLYKYNLFTRKKIGECIPFGSGPDELLRIKHFQNADTSIFVSDNQKRVVFEYNAHDLCYNPDPKPIKSVSIEEEVNSIQYIPQGYACTTINPSNKRLSFFNSKGDSINTCGDYPAYNGEMNKIEEMESYVAHMTTAINKQLIYLFYLQTDLIEIYDYTGQLKKRIQGPDHFFPHIKEIQLEGGFSRVAPIYGKAREGYFNPMVINDEIYVAYSGAFREKKPLILNTILVFDLEGHPLKKYNLSEPIIAFTVDPKTKDIIGTSDEPEYHIIRFKTNNNI